MFRSVPGASAPGVKDGTALRFRLLWVGIGYLLVAATVYNSLQANPPAWAFIAGDIWLHAVSYFVLAYWFGQLYPGRWWQVGIALAVVALGAVLELLQAATTSYRIYELSDLAANTTGAGLAWLALRTPAGRLLSLMDRGLARIRKR